MIIPVDRVTRLIDRRLQALERDVARTEMQVRAGQANGRNVLLEQVKLGVQISQVLATGVMGSSLGVERPNSEQDV